MDSDLISSRLFLAIVIRNYELIVSVMDQHQDNDRDELDRQIRILTSTEESLDSFNNAIDQIIRIMSESTELRALLLRELNVQHRVQKDLSGKIVGIANQLGLRCKPEQLMAAAFSSINWTYDPESIPHLGSVSRLMIMNPDALDEGAKSIRFHRIRLKIDKISTFGVALSGFILSGFDFNGDRHVYAVVAAALLLPNIMLNTFVEDIGVQEASVYWGFITVASHKLNKDSEFDTILTACNRERSKRFMEPLTREQALFSLSRLERLGSVRFERSSAEQSKWYIVEDMLQL